MLSRILALLALFLSINVFANKLIVQVPQQSVLFEYKNPARLSQVIQDIKENTNSYSDAYFIANQLFDKAQLNKAIGLKESVLKRLSQLEGENAVLASTLIKQIESWQVGYRLFIPLDYDEIRIKNNLDPKLSGEYELAFPKRNHFSYIVGLVEKPSEIDISNSPSLSDAISIAQPLAGADKSFVWLIYPDGHTTKSGYAYWNNSQTHLPPSTVIFVGFDSGSQFIRSLEKDIIKLISMRKSI
ncbi:capsule biosynthesis GfcC D2 domain-containing protein [Vibrio aquimaris]|uniref:Uncharacterized protein n=1 Tax=Vibrio aquimaris TaxID=2587862 RepID=A0A5P9CH35_9VIBR|nr:capsule biosynthesis GfcC D2 domain-containing protein [Vibrio aquimaris]QFT25007.1 hypothetical protein FIV01_00855 [Vibrio aquimaris]